MQRRFIPSTGGEYREKESDPDSQRRSHCSLRPKYRRAGRHERLQRGACLCSPSHPCFCRGSGQQSATPRRSRQRSNHGGRQFPSRLQRRGRHLRGGDNRPRYKGGDPTNAAVAPLMWIRRSVRPSRPPMPTRQQGASHVAQYNPTAIDFNGFIGFQTNDIPFESSQYRRFSQDVNVHVGWQQMNPRNNRRGSIAAMWYCTRPCWVSSIKEASPGKAGVFNSAEPLKTPWTEPPCGSFKEPLKGATLHQVQLVNPAIFSLLMPYIVADHLFLSTPTRWVQSPLLPKNVAPRSSAFSPCTFEPYGSRSSP